MLDRSLTEFLEQGLAVHLGTRNERMQPHGCRVTAVRVENQGQHLVAYLPKAAGPAVLDDLRSNGQAALSFARPTDDRAVQVKGVFVSERDVADAEAPFVQAQVNAAFAQLDAIGLGGLRQMNNWPLWPCVAVTIRVTAIFSQTPGPEAGAVLS